MNIGKPFRIILPFLPASATAGGLLVLSKPIWAVLLLFFVIYFIFDWMINKIDFWLRRKTKDQLWLWSYEGRKWLETPEGQDWKKKQETKTRISN